MALHQGDTVRLKHLGPRGLLDDNDDHDDDQNDDQHGDDGNDNPRPHRHTTCIRRERIASGIVSRSARRILARGRIVGAAEARAAILLSDEDSASASASTEATRLREGKKRQCENLPLV